MADRDTRTEAIRTRSIAAATDIIIRTLGTDMITGHTGARDIDEQHWRAVDFLRLSWREERTIGAALPGKLNCAIILRVV
jgi:hypothetical protein